MPNAANPNAHPTLNMLTNAQIIDDRRLAEFISPIPKPKKRKGKKEKESAESLPLSDDTGQSTRTQQYESAANCRPCLFINTL